MAAHRGEVFITEPEGEPGAAGPLGASPLMRTLDSRHTARGPDTRHRCWAEHGLHPQTFHDEGGQWAAARASLSRGPAQDSGQQRRPALRRGFRQHSVHLVPHLLVYQPRSSSKFAEQGSHQHNLILEHFHHPEDMFYIISLVQSAV